MGKYIEKEMKGAKKIYTEMDEDKIMERENVG